MLRALALATVSLLGAPAAAQVLLDTLTQTTVASGLGEPTAIAFLPDGRMLVAAGDGTVYLVEGGVPAAIGVIPVAYCGFDDFETGLLGIAVDPAFESNGRLYFYRTVGVGCSFTHNEVIRVELASDDTLDLPTLTVVLGDLLTVFPYHMGGGLRVGPDNKLWIGVGETHVGDFDTDGPGTSTNPYSQDLESLLGKILRVELDGSVPVDNPFVGVSGALPEIFAYGFRNPWRFGFDPQTDRLWAGDVGQEDLEELDFITGGVNYSWPQCEGTLPKKCASPDDGVPVLTYPHEGSKSLGSCVIGGAFAPGAFAFSHGYYFFGDFTSSALWRLGLDPSRTQFKGKPVKVLEGAGGPVDIVFGPDGALYYASLFDGEVRRLSGPAGGGAQALPGTSFTLKDGNKKSLALKASDDVALGGDADDPLFAGGSLRVMGTGFDDTYPLPAANWKYVGKAPDGVTGLRYSDPKGLSGPIRSVLVKSGKQLSIKGSGDGLGHTIGDTDPSPVNVTLTLGTRTWCCVFPAADKLKAGALYSCKHAAAPVACP